MKPNEIKPGSLLLAEPFMDDPNFKRTVVLICDHNKDGSFGFVLNKKSAMYLDDAIDGIQNFKAPLYFGGPVQTETLHFIHRLGNKLNGSVMIASGVYWGGNFEQLKEMINNGEASPKDIRFFLGYSGWESNQLMDEMKDKSWITHMVKAEHIFNTQPDQLWKTILTEKGGDYKMMVNFPEDPALN